MNGILGLIWQFISNSIPRVSVDEDMPIPRFMTIQIVVQITEPGIATTTEDLDLIDLITDSTRPDVMIPFTDDITELLISDVGMILPHSCSDLRERSEPGLIDYAVNTIFG